MQRRYQIHLHLIVWALHFSFQWNAFICYFAQTQTCVRTAMIRVARYSQYFSITNITRYTETVLNGAASRGLTVKYCGLKLSFIWFRSIIETESECYRGR